MEFENSEPLLATDLKQIWSNFWTFSHIVLSAMYDKLTQFFLNIPLPILNNWYCKNYYCLNIFFISTDLMCFAMSNLNYVQNYIFIFVEY